MTAKAAMQMPCPWHRDELRRWLQQHASGRLPHALLLTGAAGIGKFRLAESLAQTLLCQQPVDGLPCAECDACHLNAAGTHPDCHYLLPEADSRMIRIDQVRRLMTFCGRTAHRGGARLALIAPAEGLNRSAQNALLKTLEEPGHGLVLVLVSHQPSLLLPTIRSRCQQRRLPHPTQAEACEWLAPQVGNDNAEVLLAAAQGAPFAALHLEQTSWFGRRAELVDQLVAVAQGRLSPSQGARAWTSLDPRELADVLYAWLARAVRLSLMNREAGTREAIDPVVEPRLQQLAAAVPATRLLRAAQQVLDGRRQILAGANPNKELLWEGWLLALVR